MSYSDGENAISHGPMVPVAGAPDLAAARAVVELLDEHGILAIHDRDVVGAYIPRVDNNTINILVPLSMLASARRVLASKQSSASSTPAPRFVVSMTSTAPERVSADSSGQRTRARDPLGVPRPPRLEEYRRYEDEDEDDETAPIDVILPEPTPLNLRLSVAIGSIALGTAAQRLLETFWREDVRAALSAQWSRLAVEPWRLVTAGFIHGGPSHFISNALFGVLIGVVLFGTHRIGATAFVWLVSSMVGMSAEALLSPEAAIVGASAGNYGLVGLWAHGQLQRSRVSALPRRERIRTVGVLLLLVPGALTPFSSTGSKIAIMAHAAGFVAGFALGYPFLRRLLPSEFERIDQRSRWAGVLAIVVVVLCVAAAAVTYA
ncbi:MAG: rhomboid family intramembrane serine protease [Deltaproteobacteria bacterium]